MTKSPLFPGFDGLMTLSRREGVDIRPTLLRVLTDLYVQASTHSSDEQKQFVELTSRLIDEVDDATRAAVRARLALYPLTPAEVSRRLGIRSAHPDQAVATADEISCLPRAPAEEQTPMASSFSMRSKDAGEICELVFGADSGERVSFLHGLADTPLKPSPPIPRARAERAIETLEMAAFAADIENFTLELGESLILPARIAAQIVDDGGGEPLAAAMRALAMPGAVFQRVLLFLKPEFGSSVRTVYRLSRLYDRLSERSALVMLAAWRGGSLASRGKFRPTLYDDERQRARPTGATARPAVQPGFGNGARTGTDDS